jgi:hypothetical protein
MKKLLFVGVLAAALATGAILSETASAARPTKPGSGASLWVSPATAAAWGSPYTLSGSGFEPDTAVQVGQSIAGGCCTTFVVRTDANGYFSLAGTTEAPGAYVFTASIYTRKGWKEAASAMLTVQ